MGLATGLVAAREVMPGGCLTSAATLVPDSCKGRHIPLAGFYPAAVYIQAWFRSDLACSVSSIA